jgi:CheY-like chemotaxis protein
MEPVILYVEDDMLSREVMKVMLTRIIGYDPQHVYLFENSTDFENQLSLLPKQPTVIFLDIHMEPLDGFAMLKIIQKIDRFQNTKVIALTASVMNEEVKQLKDAGFMGIIAKPINTNMFPDALRRILQGEQVWAIR